MEVTMQITQLAKLRAPPPLTAGGATVTAVVQGRYSSAPEDLFRLAEIDRPAVGDDEVLVRVHAASVDRGTAAIRDLLDGQARGKLVISVPPRSAHSPDPGSTP
jgi:hypothetical protein